MKKIIAISLIIAMVICNSMTVWAADKWEGNNKYTIDKSEGVTDSADDTVTNEGVINGGKKDVKASFTLSTADKYSVTISWGSMDFTPTGTLTNEWKEGLGYYAIDNCTGWTSSGKTITITNNSNKDVKITLEGEISDSYKSNYLVNDDSKTAADLKFSGTYGVTGITSYTKVASIPGMTVKSPATYDADYNSNAFTATVDVDAKLEKSTQESVTDITLGTVTLTIAGT